MKHLVRTTLILLLVPATILFTGCRKKKDTIAKVYVIDSSTNEPVIGAQVKLVPEPTQPNYIGLIDEKITSTNRSGEAIFHFNKDYQLGQAGVAVLLVKVEMNGATATGYIKVEEETTSEKTIVYDF